MSQAWPSELPKHLQARLTAMRRESSVRMIGVLVAVGCLAGASLLLEPINRTRKSHQLVIDSDSMEGLPPAISLLGKLGTFRALAIDWASIRADRLKEEGKTYEAMQLHDTVCKLAPRFPKVWANAAWNMAYNISVLQYTPAARWQWVQNGIKLLRDRGIKYNPKSVTLYRELAWIYWHKIGDMLDDEHRNYKRALAVEMESVLGPLPVATDDETYFSWFRKIVDAPRNLEQFLKTDPAVGELVAQLRGVELSPDAFLLETVARHIRPGIQATDLLAGNPTLDPLTGKRLAVLRDPKNAERLDRLLAAIRSHVLRTRYKLNLDWMMDLMAKQFGPLDWRNPFSHTLYWASWGDKVCQGHENVNRSDAINTARIVLFALNSIVSRGRIVLWPNFDDPFQSYINFEPDTRLIPYLYDSYLRFGKEHFHDDPRFVEGTPGPIFMAGFITNMENWIQLLYLEGGKRNLDLAENFYVWLRTHNLHPDGTAQERYTKTLQTFVLGDLLDQLHTYRAAGALVNSFINKALKQMALGFAQAGRISLSHARLAHDYWMKGVGAQPRERMRMQPLRIMLRDRIEQFMQSPEVSALFKVRLWKGLPLQQRQMTYDHLRLYFEKLCANRKPAWNVTAAFDEPAGMAVARKKNYKTVDEARRKGVDAGRRFKK